MDMMKVFESAYDRMEKLKEEYEAAKEGSAKTSLLAKYQRILEAVDETCGTFEQKDMAFRAWNLYKTMRECGNGAIDLDDMDAEKAGAFVGFLKQNGVREFTYSSTWSSAVQAAMEFQKAGCQVAGLREINGRGTRFGTGERETLPAYVFII